MNKKLNIVFTMLLFLPSIVLAHTGDDNFTHHCSGGLGMVGGTGWMLFMWVLGITVILLSVLLIMWIVKQIQKK